MSTPTRTGSAVSRLTAMIDDKDRYDVPPDDLLATQLQAANDLFRDRLAKIPLLENRAAEGGITSVRSREELLPLLFAHTAYKSYPEGWLAEKKWDRLGRWLATISTHEVKDVDLDGVTNIDGWLGALEQSGHYLCCSSGTTGKSAMMNSTKADLEWNRKEAMSSFAWGSGSVIGDNRMMFGLGPGTTVARNNAIRDALIEGFTDPDTEPFMYPVPPISIGQITGMVVLRKAIADGTARPAEIAEFEATSATRQKLMDDARTISAEALLKARKRKLLLSGMYANLYPLAQLVRELGFSGKDFHPENTIYIGGGLKGATLPDDYREYIAETFNLSPERTFQMYGMQEMNAAMPRCRAQRYHVPAWLMLLLLDESGENLLPASDGEVEGRAAFFDLSVNGRWNGVISGDKIVADYNPCACGSRSPSIRDNIGRYADQPGGDKISCSGTTDAYVRGIS